MTSPQAVYNALVKTDNNPINTKTNITTETHTRKGRESVKGIYLRGNLV